MPVWHHDGGMTVTDPTNRPPAPLGGEVPDELMDEWRESAASGAGTVGAPAGRYSASGTPSPPGSAPSSATTFPRPIPSPTPSATPPPWLAPRPARPPQAADEALLVECPLCHVMVPRVAKGPPVAAILGGLVTVGAVVTAVVGGGAGWLKPLLSHMEWVIGAFIGILSVLRKLAGSRPQGGILPEECPQCGGPLRTAVLAGWAEPSWADAPYMQPRWMPKE